VSASLADIARTAFPMELCRIVAIREHGDYGYVLFDTGPKDQSYQYGSTTHAATR